MILIVSFSSSLDFDFSLFICHFLNPNNLGGRSRRFFVATYSTIDIPWSDWCSGKGGKNYSRGQKKCRLFHIEMNFKKFVTAKKTSLFNIQLWPIITQRFHFHHFVIELKPYIKRRFIDGAQWPMRCHNSAVRSCQFVIPWCLFLWGSQTQLKQHWTSNFERTITDKWNTTLLLSS